MIKKTLSFVLIIKPLMMKKQNYLSCLLIAASLIMLNINVLAQTNSYEWEIKYDDNSAEEYSAWVQTGGIVAVKFTSPYYPFTLTGGSLYVGDGSFPEGGNWLGKDILLCVFDNDGIDGMPGEMIDSVQITVNNYEWIVFDSVFNTEFNDDKDFYLGMKQLAQSPDCPPIGIDTDLPTEYRSYGKAHDTSAWFLSPYQDFMIRAKVDNLLSVKSPLEDIRLDIFPNPAKNTVSLKCDEIINSVELYDIMGSRVMKSEIFDQNLVSLDVSKLKSSVYFIKIKTDGMLITRRLLIEK